MIKGWTSVTIGEISEVVTKGTTPTSIGFKFTKSGVNYIKVESILANGEFLEEKISYIDKECHKALKRSQLREGDILFSIAGALGRTAIVNKEIISVHDKSCQEGEKRV